jgi:peptidoglycan L-alanyl-D-glutamate endopeptidase CwlK
MQKGGNMRYPLGKELMHPLTIAKINALLAECKKQGLPILITEGHRTMQEQDGMYAQGRTKPGRIITNCKGNTYQSPHQWGVAFDFCRNVKGREYDNSDGFFDKVGAIGKKLGLFWGGDFKTFTDKPHLQVHELVPGITTKALKAKFGTPEQYKKSWTTGGQK